MTQPTCRHKHVHARGGLSNAPGGESYGKWHFGPTFMDCSGPIQSPEQHQNHKHFTSFKCNMTNNRLLSLACFQTLETSLYFFFIFSCWLNMVPPVLATTPDLFVIEQIPLQTFGEAIETRSLWGAKHFIRFFLFDLISFEVHVRHGVSQRRHVDVRLSSVAHCLYPLIPAQSGEDETRQCFLQWGATKTQVVCQSN